MPDCVAEATNHSYSLIAKSMPRLRRLQFQSLTLDSLQLGIVFVEVGAIQLSASRLHVILGLDNLPSLRSLHIGKKLVDSASNHIQDDGAKLLANDRRLSLLSSLNICTRIVYDRRQYDELDRTCDHLPRSLQSTHRT